MGDRQTIRISCNTRDFLPFSQIEEFQGNLKKRSKKEISKIITSILRYGFSFPFFVWKDGERKKNAATCAAHSLGCYPEFSHQGFLQSLTEIDSGFFSPYGEPFGNRHIFSDELSAVGNVAGNVCEKILSVGMKARDCARFGKIPASFKHGNHKAFKGFLSVLHDLNFGVTLRKASVKVGKLAPISAVLKVADCWVNQIHNICSLRAFARVVSTLDRLFSRLPFLNLFSYPFRESEVILSGCLSQVCNGCRVFGLAAIRSFAKDLKALCLSCLYFNTHYAYCQVVSERFLKKNSFQKGGFYA